MSFIKDEDESSDLDVVYNQIFCSKGELNMIVAPKRMGKTAFALTMMAKGIIEHDDEFLWLSKELSIYKLMDMLSINLTKKILNHERDNSIGNQFINELIDGFNIQKMFRECSTIYNFDFLSNLITESVEKSDINCIVIDCIKLQDVKSNFNNNSAENLTFYLKSLKEIASGLNKTIVLLLEIESENSTLIFPPEIIDTFCFIYRPEYYQIVEYQNGSSTIGDAHLITVNKNKYTTNQTLKYEAAYYRFY